MKPVSSGQVYLKIVEANGLIGLNNGTSDPICKIDIKGKKASKKTDCFRKTVNPKWNEEFLIGVLSKNETISLKIYDHVRLFKDKPIGKTKITLSDIPDNDVLNMIVPLDEGEGKITFVIQFIPCEIQKFYFNRLPYFRLVLERDTYYPGEEVRGHIILNIGNRKKMRGIRLAFKGYSYVHWTESETYTTGNQTHTRTKHYTSKVTYFDSKVTIFGNERGVKKSFKAESGSYLFPFTFVLPPNLPPVFKYGYGKIYYQCKSYIDIPYARDKVIKVPFNIAVQYSSNIVSKTISVSGTKKRLFAKSEDIKVDVTSNDVCYVGEVQHIGLSIKNEGTKPINEVKIKFYSLCTYHASHGGSYKTRNLIRKYTNVNLKNVPGIPIQPGDIYEGNIELHIPDDAFMTITTSTCSNIQVQNILKIKAVTKGNVFTKTHAKVNFELLVGRRYPHIQHVVIPTQPVSTPNILNIYEVNNNSYMYMPPPPLFDGNQSERDYYFGGNVVPQDLHSSVTAFQVEKTDSPSISSSSSSSSSFYNNNNNEKIHYKEEVYHYQSSSSSSFSSQVEFINNNETTQQYTFTNISIQKSTQTPYNNNNSNNYQNNDFIQEKQYSYSNVSMQTPYNNHNNNNNNNSQNNDFINQQFNYSYDSNQQQSTPYINNNFSQQQNFYPKQETI